MALPATGVIEIRATATAGNLNGGGFNAARSGTDYTLQDAAQLTRADGTAAGGTTFGSVLGGFTDAMKGNYLHITASTGLTVGWYEIVSVTDTNNVELDRTPGTGTGTTFYIGGAMSLNSTLDDEFFETAVAGNKIWIRQAAGTVSLAESVSIAAAGGTQNPIIIEGYTSTRGDAPTGSSRPTIAQGANSFTLGANWEVKNVMLTSTASAALAIGVNGKLINCKATNLSTTTTRSAIQAASGDVFIFDSEVISYRGYGIALSSSATVYCCYVHDCDIGIRITSSSAYVLSRNIIESCVAAAIRFAGAQTAGAQIEANTLFGSVNTTGIGLDIITGTTDVRFVNNIISGFVSGVVHADAQSVGFDDYNCYSNNDTDVTNWTKGAHDITTAPAFTDVGQITFTNGTTSGSVLTSSGADFSTVTDNADFLYLVSGTGITVGQYKITAHSGTTLTLDIAPGTSATADKVGQVTTGRNFLPTGAI